MRSAQRNGDRPVGTLDRAFLILDSFGPEDGELTLAELTRRTGVPKPTVLRIAGALTDWGALERTVGGYRLGVRLFELGGLSRRQRQLRDVALPFMEDLYEATHETVHLAVLEGTTTLIVEKIAGHQPIPVPSRVGGRGPAYCTGLGKVLLAFSPPEVTEAVIAAGLDRWTPYTIVVPALLRDHLADVRRAGVAYEQEESTVGVVCAAAPVFGARREVVAAVSVAASVHRMSADRLAPAVRTAALSLSRAMAGGA
jgi:DNA-binding IclR family transcriptional regulator